MQGTHHFVVVLILCLTAIVDLDAFVVVRKSFRICNRGNTNTGYFWNSLRSDRTDSNDGSDNIQKTKKKWNRSPSEPYTIGDLRRELLRDPAQFQPTTTTPPKSKSRRTRKRVENPKQQYLYASQRLSLKLQSSSRTEGIDSGTTALASNSTVLSSSLSSNPELVLAKELGLIPTTQHCDPCPNAQPKILGSIRVNDPEDSSAAVMAYIIEKPAGWAVLGSSSGLPKKANVVPSMSQKNNPTIKPKKKSVTSDDRERCTKRISYKNDDGSLGGYIEYNELDVLALLTPEELEEYQEDLRNEAVNVAPRSSNDKTAVSSTTSRNDDPFNEDPTDDDPNTIFITSLPSGGDESHGSPESNTSNDEFRLSEQTLANLQRIAARSLDPSQGRASFAVATRPSVVSWLKDVQAAAGAPIRGGNYWTALAGAVEVDDTGLVLLCPKSCSHNICIEYIEYVAVVGNGGCWNPSVSNRKKSKTDTKMAVAQETAKLEILAKLRRGRGDDVVQTVKVIIPEQASACSNVVSLCQEQFKDGIRGDPASNPFDRRAQRRLIHCHAMSVSSLTQDDTVEIKMECLPDDIAILAERRNHLEYKQGSFLGRSSLKQNQLTTAYREINGAADGFPGWTVDRYGDWLSVYHDTKYPKGPLPSIHDGNTAGVYYLESNPNRSSMGTELDVRPRLLEGRPAPHIFPIVENGVTYLVSLNQDLSTGIFLDQRLHRGWLLRNCSPDTRLLNCFAHTGAFSVAAASAGASTVSLDLSKKWLNRLPEQLMANGIAFDERHDCIYGDCFDWLTRLAKRSELYDIVILDPPSTSIGQKRKRWSIQDMDELVALAAGLVKKGGLLWTTTNSASMSATKFARLCRKGLEDAGVSNAKLERIQPMPADFPSVGAQPVKNLVWRIP